MPNSSLAAARPDGPSLTWRNPPPIVLYQPHQPPRVHSNLSMTTRPDAKSSRSLYIKITYIYIHMHTLDRPFAYKLHFRTLRYAYHAHKYMLVQAMRIKSRVMHSLDSLAITLRKWLLRTFQVGLSRTLLYSYPELGTCGIFWLLKKSKVPISFKPIPCNIYPLQSN